MEAGRGKRREAHARRWAAILVLASVLAAALAAQAFADASGARLRVGGDSDYPPYHYVDAAGRATGFDVELARAVAADMGREPVFELGDWGASLERLVRGELDVVPMFWSAERERRYLFSEPILIRHHALFGHYEVPTVASMEVLTHARVAVQRSGLAWEALREHRGAGVVAVEVEKEADALTAVARGEAEYALVPTGIGYHAIRQSRLDGIVALSPPLLERKYVFAVRPGDTVLLAGLNRSLERLRVDGEQNRLYVEWLGHPAAAINGVPAGAVSQGHLAALFAVVLALGGVAVVARRRRDAAPAAGALLPAAASVHMASIGADGRALLDDLREAIASGRLDYALQPKTDLRSGRVLGAELLVRWHHPRLGPLAPDDFVPLAEQARSIGEMTLYLVRHGLRQCACWPGSGDGLHVSINVSSNDLADPRLVDAIIEAAGGHGRCLMLEITETAVMREPERVAEALPRLRAHGIRISVDDFGAGHSSLVNLRRLAPDELKIDRSFVGALLDSASDRAIVRATIQLGHELGASVAAEGIEDEATLAWLAEAGCDSAQGFWIARPMAPADFVSLLQERG